MECRQCKARDMPGMIYPVSWQKWRESKISDWKAQQKKAPRFNKKQNEYVNEYVNTGFVGTICHYCNKKKHVEESNLFDRIINTIENREVENDDSQNLLF